MKTKTKLIYFSIFLISTLIGEPLLSQTYTFTTAGATGSAGPTQSQINTAYLSTNLNGAVTSSLGIQSWTIPANGIYRIECYGAKGGNGQTTIGSAGAKMQGDFTLTVGQVLKIVVGQVGSNGYQGGGGGGSFVTDNSNTPLIIAGGSGGAPNTVGTSYNASNSMGTTSTSAMSGVNANASVTAGAGGTAGNGGGTSTTFSLGDGSGGGGLLTNGADGNPSFGGLAFVNGANGGAGATSTAGIGGDGGFGGGGGGDWSLATGSGGGGGYSGGGGGAYYGCGGGGGSFNAGLNQSNTSGFNAGQGYVIFTKISGVNIVQSASIACNGQLTAALTASAFGGTAPYTYSWSPVAGTGSVLTGLGAGTYTCRVQDASAVVYTNTFVITQPPVLSLAVSGKTNVSCYNGSNGAIAVSALGGLSPYTYTWSPLLNISSVLSNVPIGNYSCTVTDANGCSAGTSTNITQPAPLSVFGIATSPTVCSGQTTILIGGGALTYTWTGGVSNAVAFTPTSSSTYTLTGMDAAGCTATALASVLVNPSPTISIVGSNSLCAGNSVLLTANGALTYTWSTSVTSSTLNISPLSTSNYTVTGTNSSGCQNAAITTVTVVNLTVVTANASSMAVCLGNPLTLFGSGASTYTWSGGVINNSSFIPPSSSGYTVTGTGACGTASAAINITVNALPTVSASVTNSVVCAGNTLALSGSGAATYSWTNGVINNTAFVPAISTNYTVTGTDANGCQNVATKAITVNPLPAVLANVSNSVICLGNSTTLFGSGATTYSWTSGITDNVAFIPSNTTVYTVTGTDANGCQNMATKTVTVIPIPLVVANTTSSSVCFGNPVVLSGSGASSYTWSNGVVNNSAFTPTITTTYTLSGSNSCFTNTGVVTVTVNSLPLIVGNVSNSVVCFGNSSTLFGGGGISYSWSGGITNNVSFTPAVSANYTVTGTGANGCQNTATRSITVNALPPVTASVSNSIICFGNSTTLNGGGALTYTWTGSVLNNVAFTPGITATYTVTGTDANGCQNTAVRTVIVNQLPIITASVSNSLVCAGNSITLSGNGANTYTWSGGVLNGVAFSPVSTNTYSLAGTNTLTGCTSTNVSVITVSVNPIPFVQVNASHSVICLGGTVSLSGTNANTYTWTGGISNGVPFSPTATTMYVVSGTNTLTGCSSGTTYVVGVNPLPSLTVAVSNSVVCNGNSVTVNASGANTYTWSNGLTNGIPFFPSSTQNYSVTGTNTLTGCKNTTTRLITVNPLPIIAISATSSSVCISQTLILTANGANTYTWSGGIVNGQAFSPATSSIYSVNGTNTLTGCTSTASVTQSITVNPLPIVFVTTSSTVICQGESVVLNAGGALSYTWSTSASTSSIAVSPTIVTTYTVSGSDVNGCINTASFTQQVSECTGLSNNSKDVTVSLLVFPNPNSGQFFISSKEEINLSLVNDLGQIVKTVLLNEVNQHECTVSDLPNGIYFVTGQTDVRVIRQKIIVSK